MTRRLRAAVAVIVVMVSAPIISAQSTSAAPSLTAHRLVLGSTPITLGAPSTWRMSVAATGLGRVRFLTPTPDGRIIATDLHNLADNTQGTLWMLSGFDPASGRFASKASFLDKLRNPNSVAFYTEPNGGATWLYVAMTDQLVRYRWKDGATAPVGAPQQIARFPDYGEPASVGGWHLTRTVTVGPDDHLYVSVGSSCDACVEKEPQRASILRMQPDGADQQVWATGLRNAVGMTWVRERLMITDMGTDHLGDDAPDETVYEAMQGGFYGWPSCYQSGGKVKADPLYPRAAGCGTVPSAVAAFPAHSAPLGIVRFADDVKDPSMRGAYLVALHGSGNGVLRRGYKVVRFRPGSRPEDVITGFQGPSAKAVARPVDVLPVGTDGFLLTDDKGGNIIWVRFAGGL